MSEAQNNFDLGVFCVKKFKNIFVKKFPLFEQGKNYVRKTKLVSERVLEILENDFKF